MKFSINLNLKIFHMFFYTVYYVTSSSIKDKHIDLINQTFFQVNIQYLACNEECAFSTSDVYKNYKLWFCQKVCDAFVFLLNNIFIRFGTKLYR